MRKAIAISILTALSGIAVASAQPNERPIHEQSCHGGGGRMHKFEKLDSNSDGRVTRDEMLSRATERFDKVDANRDGSVTTEERKALHQKHAEERFTKMDKNNDGALSADELPSHFATRLLKLDADNDSKLTRAELANFAEKRGERLRARFDMDKPHTRAELTAHVEERFAKLDADRDGSLTPAELSRKQMFRRGHGAGHGGDKKQAK